MSRFDLTGSSIVELVSQVTVDYIKDITQTIDKSSLKTRYQNFLAMVHNGGMRNNSYSDIYGHMLACSHLAPITYEPCSCSAHFAFIE